MTAGDVVFLYSQPGRFGILLSDEANAKVFGQRWARVLWCNDGHGVEKFRDLRCFSKVSK